MGRILLQGGSAVTVFQAVVRHARLDSACYLVRGAADGSLQLELGLTSPQQEPALLLCWHGKDNHNTQE